MKLLDELGNEVAELNFDEVFVGDSKEITYFLYNDSQGEVVDIEVELISNTPDVLEELKILDYPKNLASEEKGEIKLKWTPSMKFRKGLKVQIKFTGVEVWRP